MTPTEAVVAIDQVSDAVGSLVVDSNNGQVVSATGSLQAQADTLSPALIEIIRAVSKMYKNDTAKLETFKSITVSKGATHYVITAAEDVIYCVEK